MSIEDVVTSFMGQLFHGEAKSKSWTPLIAGQVMVHLQQKEGRAWWMVAKKKEETWQKCLDSNFKYRIKDNFIQWQYHGDSGEMETFGLRVKNGDIAKQFGKAVDMILKTSPAIVKHGSFSPAKKPSRAAPSSQAPPTSKSSSPPPAKRSSRATPPVQAPPTSKQSSDPSAKRPSRAAPVIQAPPPPHHAEKIKEVEECVVLKVQIPGKEETAMKVPRSVPLERILKSVCGRKQLDPALYAVAQPPDSAHGQPLLCHTPNMTVGDLKTYEIHLVRKDSQPKQPDPLTEEGGGEQLLLLQVELPKSEHTVIRVSPSILMGELLCFICGKRNINPAHHRFDLPVTEESLAHRSLQQLKINSIKIIAKASAPAGDTTPPKVETPPSPQKSKQKGKKKSSDSDPGGSPLHRGPRRGVAAPLPPPMQRRKTQPDFVHELEKELTGRRNTEGKATPPVPRVNGEGVGSESKTTHPPVRRDGEVTASTPSEQPADEVDGGKSKDSPRKSKRAFLSPRTIPAPLPPGTGEAGKGKGQPPPPVSSKPQAKGHMKQESVGSDEPDFATPANGVCRSEEGKELSAAQARNGLAGMEGFITSALKEQAENRFSPMKSRKKEGAVGEDGEQEKRRHGSLEKEKVRALRSKAPPAPPTADGAGDFSSLRKKPKGPAPLPPPLARAHTLGRMRHLDTTTKSLSVDQGGDSSGKTRRKTETSFIRVSSEGTPELPKARSISEVVPPFDVQSGGAGGGEGKMRRPTRKAPTRPPPSAPNKTSTRTEGKKATEFEKPPPILESDDHKEAVAEEAPQPILTGRDLAEPPVDLPPPPTSLPVAQRHGSPKTEHGQNEVSPRTLAMAICKETEDGGKMLIVKPSPGSMRRSLGATPIIFKLPPPPPQPPSGTEQPTKPPTEVPSKDSPPDAPSSGLPPEVPSSELPPEVPLSVPPLEDSNEVESTLLASPVEARKEKKREGKKKEGKVKKSKPKTSEKPKRRKTRSKTPPTEDMARPETPPMEDKPHPQTPPRTTPPRTTPPRTTSTENRPHPETPPTEDKPHPQTPPRTTPPRTTPTENRPHPETPPKPKVKPNRPRSKPHAQPDKVEVDLPVVAPPDVSKTTMPPSSEVTPPAALEATSTTPSAMSEGVSDVSSNFSPIVSPGGGLLNATIVSNEFTNFDDLLSNSSLQDLVTTDFSIEENLEPPRDSGGDSGTGTRLDSAGMSVGSRSDSDISVTSDEGGFHIPSDDEDAGRAPARGSPKKYKFQRTTPTKPSSSHASPSRSPGIRRPVPPPPTQHHGIGVGVTNPMMLLVNSNANNNNNNNNNNVDGNSVDGNGVHDNIVAGNIVAGGAENAMGHRLSTVSTTSANSGTEGVWSPSGHGNKTTHRYADGYMSGEPMSGSESDTAESAHSLEDAFDDNGEIVLLSVKPRLEQEGVALAEGDSESAAIADVESGCGHAEEGWVGEIEGSKVAETEVKMGGYKMGDATLNELDSVVSDLRELVEQTTPPQDSTRVVSDDAPLTDSPVNMPLPPPPPPPVSDLPPSPPPSPPPPISSLPPSPPPSPASSHTNPSPSPSPSSSLPPSPPPPVPVAPALPPSLTEERNIGTPPPPPPPPSSLPPPLTEEDTTNTSPFNKKVRSRFSSKPKPPTTKPATSNKPKGLFKRKHSLTRATDVDDADSAKDELFEKMRERQAKLKAEAHNSSPKHSHRTLEDSDKPGSQSNSSPLNSGSSSNIDQQKNSGSGSNPGGNSGGDNVQMQLQFLQQQVIQQQMVQLQQQFQQLLAMNPGITLPGMGGAGMGMGMPNMGVGGMNVQGMAMNMPGIGMNTSPAMAGMGMNPNMNMPGMGFVQGNQMGMVAQNPQASAVGGIPQGHPMMSPQVMAMQQQQMMSPQMVPQMMSVPQVASSQMGMASVPVQMGMASASQMGMAPGGLNSSEQPVVPAVNLSQPQSTSQSSSDSNSTGRRKSECVVQRSEVMGQMEGHFDLLMDDIRETNPHNILRKTPPTQTPPGQQSEEDEPDSSSYAGMATALANAIKERRQHISDKRQSLEESTSFLDQEWQSP